MDSMEHLVEYAKATIRGHRSRGTFSEGHQFITALPHTIRSLTSVAIEIAQLYLVQGLYTLAAETCEDQKRHVAGEEGAVLELLQAFIGIGRYSKLRTALKTAQVIGLIWHLNPEDQTQLESMAIAKTTEADVSLTEQRVLMIHWYWKIYVVAAEQGLLDEKQTKAAAVSCLAPVLQRAIAEGRFREARFLMYSKAHLLDDANRAVKELTDFQQSLTDPAWVTERAFTLIDLADLQLKTGKDDALAQANLELASDLFNKVGHTFGNIDIDLVRLSADRTISAGERFLAKTKIADRYFAVNHYQNGIRCLAFAISPDMIVDTYYEDVVRSLELLDRKISDCGGEILKQVSLLHSVCQASLKAPEYGFALESLKSYFRNVPEEISPKYHSYMGVVLGLVYSKFGEHQKALEVANQALEIAMSSASYIDQSDAATQVGVHMLGLAREQPEGSDKFVALISAAVNFLKEWADKDADHDYGDGEAQKCLFVAEWDNDEQLWIKRVKKQIPDSADPLTRIPVVHLELRLLMRQGRFSDGLALSTQFLEQLQINTDLSPFKKAQTLLSACIQAYACVQNIFRGDQATPENTQSAVKLLWAALQHSYNALQLYRQAHGVEMVVDCTLFVWEILCMAIITMQEDARHQLLGAFMDEMIQTEKLCDSMRQSVFSVGGLQSLMHKRFLVSKEASLKLYSVAVSLASKLDDSANAWLWLQRGKARAFADSLGATHIIPQRLLEQINRDHAAYELLREEQNILELLQEPNVNHVVAARRLASLRKSMESHPLLAEAARFRGQLFNLDLGTEELKTALQVTGLTPEQVKFVDWYVPTLGASSSNQQIHLFVRQLDGTTHSKQLPIDVGQVKDWTAKTFVYPDMATPPLARKIGNQLLKKMNDLLEGLSKFTAEGDLLILSPSGPLNNVPLHALDVGKVPLLERNLVVYASSVATLGQCLIRLSSTQGIDEQPQKGYSTKYFALYEEPDRLTERDQIFEHIKSLPQSVPGTVGLGPQVTKSYFLKECATANWIHYHGHARYNQDDILKSSLVLSDGTDIFDPAHEDGVLSIRVEMDLPEVAGNEHNDGNHDGGRDDEDDTIGGDEGIDELLVSELFEAKLPRGGVHFTIIACDSGTQDIAPGDEPLGIIPALLYAGATSVLGCQWPIDSRAGRAFSEAFYQEIAVMQAVEISGLGRAINLAGALRSTVIKMRKGELGPEFKQAYYWAPFVLHGLWYFSRG